MARNREKKALYEVIGQTLKSRPDNTLEKLHSEDVREDEQKNEQTAAKPPARTLAKWLNRPRIVQFAVGRIDISISYPLAIAILLGLILLLLVVFRLGQISSSGPAESSATVLQNTQKAAFEPKISAPLKLAPVEEKATVPQFVPKAEPVTPKGDNRIVIQAYQIRADLEPVRKYFAEFGIETDIMKIGDWYYLVTVDKYDNPEKPGTDGYAAKQRIIKLGAEYKAPLGYETFGSKPFNDAYGKKFDE